MKKFCLPREIYYGNDAISCLSDLKGKKATICTGGSSMKKYGFLQEVIDLLHKAKFDVDIIDQIEPDPSVETVERGAEKMLKFKPDLIVAIGGGSAIDGAKAMWIKYEYPEITFEEMCKVFGLPKLRNKARFVAIPSTSGTATEVTAFSVITDNKKGIKYPLADYEITPDIAVLDSRLTLTMPRHLVAHTGMDAFTHAVECFVSTASSPFTDPLALQAIKMIMDNIFDSYHGEEVARENMHYAQCLAGMAFSNGLLGIVHSLAHKTGAIFADLGGHIIHGVANAMYLPRVIEYNAKDEYARARYLLICKYLGLGGEDNNQKIQSLVNLVVGLTRDLQIAPCISKCGVNGEIVEEGFVSEQEFLSRVDAIAENALLDACTLSNPRKPTKQVLVEILKCCYYGTSVKI